MEAYEKFRRIGAWIMIVLFVALIANLLFFHVMMGESLMLYIGLIVVFFLGNGLRGRAQQHERQEQQESGEAFGKDE